MTTLLDRFDGHGQQTRVFVATPEVRALRSHAVPDNLAWSLHPARSVLLHRHSRTLGTKKPAAETPLRPMRLELPQFCHSRFGNGPAVAEAAGAATPAGGGIGAPAHQSPAAPWILCPAQGAGRRGRGARPLEFSRASRLVCKFRPIIQPSAAHHGSQSASVLPCWTSAPALPSRDRGECLGPLADAVGLAEAGM